MMLSRRRALFGLLAAPVIIRTPGLLMPVRPVPPLRLLDLLPDYYPTDEFIEAMAIETYQTAAGLSWEWNSPGGTVWGRWLNRQTEATVPNPALGGAING